MRRLPLSAPLLALLLAAAACSGEEAPQESAGQAEETGAAADPDAEAHVRRAAEGFLASLMAADGEAGCALMDEAARTVVAEAHGAQDCPEGFPLYAESLQGGEGIEVGEITMGTGPEDEVPVATVALVYPGEDRGPLEMRRDSDDQWVATHLPGTSPGGA